jgi:FkbM family methyltransferase
MVPRARTIIDGGASFGVYSLAAASLNPEAKIVAFEPLDRSYQRLARNIALNGFSVRAERLALSDKDGSAVLYDDPGRDRYRGASLVADSDVSHDRIEHSIQAARLDTFCRENEIESIDLVKLDIEGHEAAALAGMAELIAKGKPAILIEVLTAESGAQVWSKLQPLGYKAYRVDENRGLIAAASLNEKSGVSRNYLVCQPSAVNELGLESFVVG